MNNLDRCANIFKEYSLYYHGLLYNNKGGVAVYIKKDLYVHEKYDLILIDNCRLDNIWLEIVTNGVRFVVGNVY